MQGERRCNDNLDQPGGGEPEARLPDHQLLILYIQYGGLLAWFVEGNGRCAEEVPLCGIGSGVRL